MNSFLEDSTSDKAVGYGTSDPAFCRFIARYHC